MLVILAVATVLIRARFIGNPNIDADEQFYLLAGDRLLKGALPYVDIWDRKPLGLFLLFAGIRLLGGDGVLGYQLVAASFVAGTAVLIAIVARRIAPPRAAWCAALAYAPLLGLSGGQGGQTPVFYNLPVAIAAWLVLRQLGKPARARIRLTGCAAMLLVGVAMQVKYTALFEGVYLGVVLLAIAWRRTRRVAPLLLDGATWIAAALLPTGLAWLAYAALGHGAAFAYANFTSIFWRTPLSAQDERHNIGHILGRLSPALLPAIVGEGVMRTRTAWWPDTTRHMHHRFLAGWLLAAVAGVAIFGTYFNHYALPLLPPLLIVAAPALGIGHRRIGAVLTMLLLGSSLIWYYANAARLERRKGDGAYAYALADRIRPMLNGGCLFIFYDEPIYYHLTGSCLPTRWPFPYHLSLTRESRALGVDAHAELARILGARPPVILTQQTDDPELDRGMDAQLRATLRRDYRLVYSHRFGGHDPATDQLWRRRDAVAPRQ